MITKSKAKETLQLNFTSLDRAAEKLGDECLIESFSNKQYPVTYKVSDYLLSLDKDVSQLENICATCGIHYFYTPMCSATECRHCNNLDRFVDNMITEPSTVAELIVNLKILSTMFDHEDTRYKFREEIAHWESYEEYEKRPKDVSLGQFE